MKSSIPRRAAGCRARQRGFLDFSFSELAIIFGVALVVLGPKKLPGLVSQVGRWVGRARMMARQFRDQWEQEVNQIQSIKPVHYRPPNPAPAAPGGTEHTQPASSGTRPEAGTAADATPAHDSGAAGAGPAAVGGEGTQAHEAFAASAAAEPGAGQQGTLDLGESVPQFALHGTEPVVIQPHGETPGETPGEAPGEAPGAVPAETAGEAPSPPKAAPPHHE